MYYQRGVFLDDGFDYADIYSIITVVLKVNNTTESYCIVKRLKINFAT